VLVLVCCCWYEPERVCCGACVVGMLAIEFCVCVCSKSCLLRAKSSKRCSLGDVDNSRSALLLGNENRYCFDCRLS
jgi:hypothetical protein